MDYVRKPLLFKQEYYLTSICNPKNNREILYTTLQCSSEDIQSYPQVIFMALDCENLTSGWNYPLDQFK